ncbi:MAG: glycosyltransferase family 4 protein [Candidatus Aenigmarchaeota archaeon]|nr:glycosyltransferase family 4 protein [Candidatus Aenigmarchaeota archaeon]
MRLLIVTPKYPPQFGGAAYVFSLIAEHLKEKTDVSVLTSSEKGFIEAEKRNGVKVVRLFPYFEKLYTKLILSPLTFLLTLSFFLLNSRKFDVVETHTVGELCIFSQFFAKIFRKKLVKHVIDMGTPPFLLRHPVAEKYICCGQVIANKFRRIGIGEERIEDIHLPIIKSRKEQEVKNKIRKLAFIGEISKQKGIEDILFVLGSIKDDFEMLFIGTGHLEDEVRNSKDNRIKYLGRLEHDKVIELLKTTDVLIHPTYSDVLPLSILEAMMLGNAVISTDIGEIKKTVGKGGIIIKAGDRKGLEDAIIYVLRNDLAAMKAAAKANFEKYAEEDVYKRNLEVLEEALRRQ